MTLQTAPPRPASVLTWRNRASLRWPPASIEARTEPHHVAGPRLPPAPAELYDSARGDSPAKDSSTPRADDAPDGGKVHQATPIPITRFHETHARRTGAACEVRRASAGLCNVDFRNGNDDSAGGGASPGSGAASSQLSDTARLPLDAQPNGPRPVILPLAGAAPGLAPRL